jgi:NAD(P)-dependent dehydrogenase (short-subunit alcohol dehydrogenase family)
MGGRVVVVTGGSRGLGRAMCEHFAAAGDAVVVASRKLEPCEALAEDLSRRHGVRALGVSCHVGSWSDCDALMDRVLEEFGRVDVLVNNAGMSPLYPSLGEVSEALFDKVVAVNLKGAFRLGVRAGEAMRERDGGTIVNISSIAAVAPQSYDLPYAAAKAALNTVTRGLARAYAPTVRVNAIMAGPFRTDVTAAWTDETLERTTGDRLPLGRLGEPEEIVGTVDYLTGGASSFTTGAVLTVDGGMVS